MRGTEQTQYAGPVKVTDVAVLATGYSRGIDMKYAMPPVLLLPTGARRSTGSGGSTVVFIPPTH
jgi:hypothetical protein